MSNKAVAMDILNQLGGNKFVVMTGSKNFIYDDNSLQFTIGRNSSKANRVTITLNGKDLYDVRFHRYTAPRMNSKTFEFSDPKDTTIKEVNDVYFDMLQELFTEVTGMYTRLF